MEVSQKKKLETQLPYDPAIPFLGMDPKEMKKGSQRNACMLVFIAGLFTIAEIRKQPTCLLVADFSL